MRKLLRAVALALCLCASDAAAHPGGERRLHDLHHEIERRPGDATLYLRRADLHIERGNLDAAGDDVRRARELRPDFADVDLFEGLLLVEQGRWGEATRVLTRYLDHDPRHARARTLRARAHRASGRPLRAAADMRVAFEVEPIPAHALEQARDLVAAERSEQAIAALQHAVDTIGPNVVLVDFAVRIERQRQNWGAALAWYDRMPATLLGSPIGLKRRGDLLVEAGREDEARLSYRQALEAFSRFPPARRRTPKLHALEAELRHIVKEAPGDSDAN